MVINTSGLNGANVHSSIRLYDKIETINHLNLSKTRKYAYGHRNTTTTATTRTRPWPPTKSQRIRAHPPSPLLYNHGHRRDRHLHFTVHEPGYLARRPVTGTQLATRCWLVPHTDTGILPDLDPGLRNYHRAYRILQRVCPSPSLWTLNHVAQKLAG